MPRLLCLRQQLLKVEMEEDKRLEMDVKLFLRRKNEVISKLDLAVEVVATAFGIELESIQLPKVCFGLFVLMFMVEAMQTMVYHRTKAARQLVIFGAVMELHVPTDRDKQHRKGHQKGTDLQQPLFHGCKNREKGAIVSFFSLISRLGTMANGSFIIFVKFNLFMKQP